MESNKDEALRCISIAQVAFASGDKQRALKFVRIAQRLNHNIHVDDDLLDACKNVEFTSHEEDKPVDQSANDGSVLNHDDHRIGDGSYTKENAKLIHEIKRNKDYYAILGVGKSCSVEEIKRAYKKLSLKVHPDKNKAPGSEEAFKKVCEAFKCLSDEDSRKHYDRTGLVQEFEYNKECNIRRSRRRRTTHDFFDDDFDPDEIFKSFFGHKDMFPNANVNRARRTANQKSESFFGGFDVKLLIQLLPILIFFVLAYIPYSEPEYHLHKSYAYKFPKVTKNYGVEYYVKSPDFDVKFPFGSSSRASLEDHVARDYRNMLWRYCHVELRRRQWDRNYQTPHCNKLQNFGVS